MCDFVLLQGVGTVVAGTALCGVIHANDVLQLGPDAVGQFLPCTIKSIHRKRMPVTEVHAGQTATFALKKVRRSRARFGFRRTAFKSLSDAPVMCYFVMQRDEINSGAQFVKSASVATDPCSYICYQMEHSL